MTQRQQRNLANIWAAVRHMILPELERFRRRYPHSRRLPILEAMFVASVAEDDAALSQAGAEYLALTGVVPPGCYVIRHSQPHHYFLAGEKVPGRRRGLECTVCRFSPHVWR